MNKQKLIDKLARLLGSMEKFKGIADFYDGKYAGLEHALELIKKLDEPQKPVVPGFVAEWFERNKDNLEFAIWELCVDSYNAEAEPGIIDWIQCPENKPIETLIRMKDGYEVEKELLYEVIIGDLYLIKKFNNRNDFCFDTSRSLCAWEKSAYQLTEEKIKEIDERYWAFAVPVEEVVKRMKTYTIKFYGNTTFVHILSGLKLDFRGYSRDDLLESLWGYGYLNEDELISLEKFTNAWMIEEEAE